MRDLLGREAHHSHAVGTAWVVWLQGARPVKSLFNRAPKQFQRRGRPRKIAPYDRLFYRSTKGPLAENLDTTPPPFRRLGTTDPGGKAVPAKQVSLSRDVTLT
jgi:hypothetical protein